jgi:hypothetical protein
VYSEVELNVASQPFSQGWLPMLRLAAAKTIFEFDSANRNYFPPPFSVFGQCPMVDGNVVFQP